MLSETTVLLVLCAMELGFYISRLTKGHDFVGVAGNELSHKTGNPAGTESIYGMTCCMESGDGLTAWEFN